MSACYIFCVLPTMLFHSLVEKNFYHNDFIQVKVSYNNDTTVLAVVAVLFVVSRKVFRSTLSQDAIYFFSYESSIYFYKRFTFSLSRPVLIWLPCLGTSKPNLSWHKWIFFRLLCFIYCCYHHFKAFGATEAMTDRICIASNGEKKPHLSAEDLATCCSTCGFGCKGGYPGAAWQYWEDTGTQRVVLTTRRINIQGQQ